MRAMATRWRMPAGKLVRILVAVGRYVESDPPDPAASVLIALIPRYALTFQAEGDVVEHGAVVEAGVILEDHAPIRAGADHRLAHHKYLAARWRMVWAQAGDQPQDRALAAAAGSQDADKLSLVDQVLDNEPRVADRGEFVGAPRMIRLGDVAELHDVRLAHLAALPNAREHTTHADLAGGRRWGRQRNRIRCGSSCVGHRPVRLGWPFQKSSQHLRERESQVLPGMQQPPNHSVQGPHTAVTVRKQLGLNQEQEPVDH